MTTSKILPMQTSVDIFLGNLEEMIKNAGWSNRQLSQKSGVSDRLIGMYRNRESTPSIEKAEQIAKALGFELWQMQMPDFQPKIIKSYHFEQLCRAYIITDDAGRKVMDTNAEYITTHKAQKTG